MKAMARKKVKGKPNQRSFRIKQGLDTDTVKTISAIKSEPRWMREFRLRALRIFERKPLPTWGADLSPLKLDKICYYVRPTDRSARRWEDLPSEIRETYTKLGIPKAEQQYLAGVSAQYESEVVYGSLREELAKQGVIFLCMDEALQKYPEIIKEYFGTVVAPDDNKFAALNSAVWSGGSFIYIPPKVKVSLPLHAFFAIESARFGQFERTLIIADKDSFVHYVEGCTAPIYSENSLHAAVVEVIVKEGARVRYSTAQNWSRNVYNLTTKRAFVEEEGVIEWVSGSLGSRVTMLYPSSCLRGKGARADHLLLSLAGEGQVLDTGAKVFHLAPQTSSRVLAKSISRGGGKNVFRGLLQVAEKAKEAKGNMRCNALLLDETSQAETFPSLKIKGKDVAVGHEATVGKVGEEQLFYLRSRGLDEEEATGLIVNGFIEPIIKEFPLEFAVEINQLIQLKMKGATG